MLTMLLGVALLPVVILMIFIYRKDDEKEPLRLLLKAFAFGALSIVPAIVMEMVLQGFNPVWAGALASSCYEGFVVAGFSEELCKLLLLSWAVWRSREFNEYFDGIVYATFVALGFACFENLSYIFEQGSYADSLATGVMRALLSVPGHFLFGVTMGYFFSLAKFDPRHRVLNMVKALLYPMLLHGTFDSILMFSSAIGDEGVAALVSSVLMVAFVIFDIRMWKWGLRRIRRLQARTQEQNFDRNNPFEGFTWRV